MSIDSYISIQKKSPGVGTYVNLHGFINKLSISVKKILTVGLSTLIMIVREGRKESIKTELKEFSNATGEELMISSFR